MKSSHGFLALGLWIVFGFWDVLIFWFVGALRFMRRIIAMKDEYYNRYIIKGNLFGPVIDAFIHNNGRYNLLDSAFWDMLEFIKMVGWFWVCQCWN